jgi:hypothetical protein
MSATTTTYSLAHLSDSSLLDGLTSLVRADRNTTAALLAHIAEVDARKLYLPAACSSMHGYCVRVLRLSEDAAYRRITAARAARRFPVIFEAVADGRLHLTAVVMLAAHLADDTAGELLAAAAHKSRAEIELLLARRFPRPDLPDLIQPAAPPSPAPHQPELAPARVDPLVTKAKPLAPERFAVQMTIDQATRDKLVRAQALLRHRVPSGDLAQVVDRALDALLRELEKEKFAATPRPRAARGRASASNPRYIPNDVKRAAHQRDGEQCAFVSESGERCGERGFLEFDHVDPVARGGQPTRDRVRILCQAHNQYEAERIFGAGYVKGRRQETRASRAAAPSVAPPATPADELQADTLSGLRGLGVKPADARRALERSAAVPATTLEERLRAALAALHAIYSSRCAEDSRPGWGFPTGSTSWVVRGGGPRGWARPAPQTV